MSSLRHHAIVDLRPFTAEAVQPASLRVAIEIDVTRLCLEFHYAIPGLLWPPAGAPTRRDGIWQATCAELFVSWHDGAYREFNFGADGAWAAYEFGAYRAMTDAAPVLPAPGIEFTDTGAQQILRVTLDTVAHFDARIPTALGLSAVGATIDGLHYWALRHPAARPDFHDPAGFAWPWPTH